MHERANCDRNQSTRAIIKIQLRLNARSSSVQCFFFFSVCHQTVTFVQKSSPSKSGKKSTRSTRGKGGDGELVELKEDPDAEEEEAEFSGEQSSDVDSD